MLTTWTEGGAELGVGGFGFYADPCFRTTFLASTKNSNWTRYGYDNEEYNELYQKSIETDDFDTRYECYSKMAAKAIDEAGWFMLYCQTSNCAMKSDVEGVIYRGSGNSDFTGVHFTK